MGARRLALLLLLGSLGCFVLASLIPEDVVPAEAAVPVAVVVMLCGLVVAGELATRLMPGTGMRRVAIWVVVLACVKLGIGLWYWDMHMYALSDQRARETFSTSDVYWERQSDTAVVDELLALFRRNGLDFYGVGDAHLSTNNRVPAHLTALLVRAFGGQYAGSFPIVAMFAGFASLALAAATVRRVSPMNQRMAVALAVAWPLGWVVCSVMKDPLLFAFATMIAAYLSVSGGTRDTALGLALATAILPLFRPAYLAVCGALLLIWLLRSRAHVLVKVGGVATAAGVAFLVLPLTDALARVGGYLEMEANDSLIMQVPIFGRVAYGLMTPFPWTQILEDWWKAQYVPVAATAVVTIAFLFALVRRHPRELWTHIDYGAALAAGMTIGGITSPQIAPLYVQVGTAGLLPLALRTPVRFGRMLALSLVFFLVANVLWLLVR